MTAKAVSSDGAPGALGPYSQAVEVDGWLILSGQIGLDPASGELVGDDTVSQAGRALDNCAAVLEAAGLDLAAVVKVTLYLVDLGDFAAVNEIYAQRFVEPYPARVTVGVAALPKGARIEVEMAARRP